MYQVVTGGNEAFWFDLPNDEQNKNNAFEKARALEDEGDAYVRVFEFSEGELVSSKEVWQSVKL